MSNRIHIEATEFRNVRGKEKTYGYRMYDDYDQTYDNSWDSIPDDDLDVLKKVLREPSKVADEMIDTMGEDDCGIYINGEWYEWEKIKDIIEE